MSKEVAVNGVNEVKKVIGRKYDQLHEAIEEARDIQVQKRHNWLCEKVKEMGVHKREADFGGFIGKSVIGLSEALMAQKHTGMTATMTVALFAQLFNSYQEA